MGEWILIGAAVAYAITRKPAPPPAPVLPSPSQALDAILLPSNLGEFLTSFAAAAVGGVDSLLRWFVGMGAAVEEAKSLKRKLYRIQDALRDFLQMYGANYLVPWNTFLTEHFDATGNIYVTRPEANAWLGTFRWPGGPFPPILGVAYLGVSMHPASSYIYSPWEAFRRAPAADVERWREWWGPWPHATGTGLPQPYYGEALKVGERAIQSWEEGQTFGRMILRKLYSKTAEFGAYARRLYYQPLSSLRTLIESVAYMSVLPTFDPGRVPPEPGTPRTSGLFMASEHFVREGLPLPQFKGREEFVGMMDPATGRYVFPTPDAIAGEAFTPYYVLEESRA